MATIFKLLHILKLDCLLLKGGNKPMKKWERFWRALPLLSPCPFRTVFFTAAFQQCSVSSNRWCFVLLLSSVSQFQHNYLCVLQFSLRTSKDNLGGGCLVLRNMFWFSRGCYLLIIARGICSFTYNVRRHQKSVFSDQGRNFVIWIIWKHGETNMFSWMFSLFFHNNALCRYKKLA